MVPELCVVAIRGLENHDEDMKSGRRQIPHPWPKRGRRSGDDEPKMDFSPPKDSEGLPD